VLGDVKLRETADGKEYLEFDERQTKTRTGSDCRDIRAMPPKMFATDGSEKDPIVRWSTSSTPRRDLRK